MPTWNAVTGWQGAGDPAAIDAPLRGARPADGRRARGIHHPGGVVAGVGAAGGAVRAGSGRRGERAGAVARLAGGPAGAGGDGTGAARVPGLDAATLAAIRGCGMNEQEWLTSDDPAAMLEYLHGPVMRSRSDPMAPREEDRYRVLHREGSAVLSDRKLRLFADACREHFYGSATNGGTESSWEYEALVNDHKMQPKLSASRWATEMSQKPLRDDGVRGLPPGSVPRSVPRASEAQVTSPVAFAPAASAGVRSSRHGGTQT